MPYGTVNTDKLQGTLGGIISPDSSVFRNRIINGAMVVDQRNAGASFTATDGGYSLDRWKGNSSQVSKFTIQQNAGSVTPPAGFTNYLGVTSSAATSVGANDYYLIRQAIEGLNTSDLGFGTANAKTVTLSFWVRSSLTGTFSGTLNNSAVNRSYPYTYTISSANTWEYKTVTIAGDTSGTWLTTNGIGLWVSFSLGMGSTYSAAAGSWVGAEEYAATGSVSVVGTNGATFYITGVQLEAGSTASSFEYRNYGQELALCQRYCQRYRSAQAFDFYGMVFLEDSSTVNGSIFFPTTMRSAPSATLSAGNTFRIYTTGGFTASAISFQSASINSAIFFLTVSGATGGQAGKWQDAGSNNSSIILSAEL
jgi:hypothetical protein